jgi:uncharacterized protein YxjI
VYLIRERFFRLGEDSDITDDQGRPVLYVDGKVLSLHDRLVIRDPPATRSPRCTASCGAAAHLPDRGRRRGGRRGPQAAVHPFGDRFTIDVPGPDDLEVRGNLLDHEFTVRRGDQTVATISKRWFSIRDTYAVEVAPGQDDLLILAAVLALDLAEDREREQR